jgi:hypothetical protein
MDDSDETILKLFQAKAETVDEFRSWLGLPNDEQADVVFVKRETSVVLTQPIDFSYPGGLETEERFEQTIRIAATIVTSPVVSAGAEPLIDELDGLEIIELDSGSALPVFQKDAVAGTVHVCVFSCEVIVVLLLTCDGIQGRQFCA